MFVLKLESTADDIIKTIENGNIDITFFEKLWRSFLNYLPTLVAAIVIFIIGTIINKLIMLALGKGLEKSRLDKTVHSFLKSLVQIVLFAVVLITVLTILGIPMTSLIAVVGSAGLAVGLAMQGSLSNVAGGVLVLAGKHFKVGDYISVNGTEGTVAEITILCTRLVTFDNRDIYIPNGTVSNATIINYTQEKTRRVDWTFGVSYNNDVKETISVINNVLAEYDKVLCDPAPFVKVSAFSSSSIEFTVRAWVNSSDYWEVYFNMFELIKDAFDRNSIVIPYNQLDVHMIEKK